MESLATLRKALLPRISDEARNKAQCLENWDPMEGSRGEKPVRVVGAGWAGRGGRRMKEGCSVRWAVWSGGDRTGQARKRSVIIGTPRAFVITWQELVPAGLVDTTDLRGYLILKWYRPLEPVTSFWGIIGISLFLTLFIGHGFPLAFLPMLLECSDSSWSSHQLSVRSWLRWHL